MFVKICGTTSEEDALLAVALGADAVGFIFAPSRRQIAPGVVGDIVKRLPPEVLTVGVFRDEAPSRVVDIMAATGLRSAQLNGHESPEECRWIRERVRSTIRAFPATDRAIPQARDYGADAVLIDSPSFGSGQVFDWRLADGVPDGVRLILAGGLNAENVGEAVAAVHPWGVDVATGVESSPGKKDPRKLREFIAAARAAEPAPYEGGADAPYDWMDEW
ncbi:MAG: phosphoribosylanthranilate isomerase [Actinomycetota bacterium]|jgi:phosphoribosylanthranilate isomerase|nr:phosphoribosylanthranilate isomerase [Actinomycetota bacterium]